MIKSDEMMKVSTKTMILIVATSSQQQPASKGHSSTEVNWAILKEREWMHSSSAPAIDKHTSEDRETKKLKI
jgi:hypothetical protein